jgi:hypothetical protein
MDLLFRMCSDKDNKIFGVDRTDGRKMEEKFQTISGL